MSGAKLAQSKRTMHALTSLHKKRKIPTKAEIADLNVQLRTTPKLSDDRPSLHDAFFGEMSQIVNAKRRYV
jgi:hypothetical protein